MFKENYYAIAAEFGEKFRSHKCEKNVKIDWPKGFGVYVVWKIVLSSEELIYVGMTGKFKKKVGGGYAVNSGKFSERKYRWTPYLFQEVQEDGFSFRYGPRYSNSEIRLENKLELDAYSDSISYDNLRVDFFNFSADVDCNCGYTPSLLEAKLLTEYLIETKSLPPANFEI